MYEEDYEEINEEEYGSDIFSAEESDDLSVLEEVRNKTKQSRQGFKSRISRKRVHPFEMDEIFLM